MNCQKELFQLDPSKHYLNCAYMGPLLKSVEKAGMEGMIKKRTPYKIQPSDFFKETEELRREFSKLIGSSEPERSVVIPSASYGLGVVAKNIQIKKGENIVVVGEQFPSNVYPWMSCVKDHGELIVVHAPNTRVDRGRQWNEAILNSINEQTRMVAMPHVHWADGTKFDLHKIRKRTKEVGALLVIDGTQSVGALPFLISEIDPDALICAGYKWLLGPYSIGMAYFGSYFDGGEPIEENWINRADSENFKGLVNYEKNYQPGALRYEVGEHSNFILVPMLLEALRQLNEWGVSNINRYAEELLEPFRSRIKQAGYWLEEKEFSSPHMFGIWKKEMPSDLNSRLSEKNISLSERGESLRISLHVWNNAEDLEALIGVLTE